MTAPSINLYNKRPDEVRFTGGSGGINLAFTDQVDPNICWNKMLGDDFLLKEELPILKKKKLARSMVNSTSEEREADRGRSLGYLRLWHSTPLGKVSGKLWRTFAETLWRNQVWPVCQNTEIWSRDPRAYTKETTQRRDEWEGRKDSKKELSGDKKVVYAIPSCTETPWIESMSAEEMQRAQLEDPIIGEFISNEGEECHKTHLGRSGSPG